MVNEREQILKIFKEIGVSLETALCDNCTRSDPTQENNSPEYHFCQLFEMRRGIYNILPESTKDFCENLEQMGQCPFYHLVKNENKAR